MRAFHIVFALLSLLLIIMSLSGHPPSQSTLGVVVFAMTFERFMDEAAK